MNDLFSWFKLISNFFLICKVQGCLEFPLTKMKLGCRRNFEGNVLCIWWEILYSQELSVVPVNPIDATTRPTLSTCRLFAIVESRMIYNIYTVVSSNAKTKCFINLYFEFFIQHDLLTMLAFYLLNKREDAEGPHYNLFSFFSLIVLSSRCTSCPEWMLHRPLEYFFVVVIHVFEHLQSAP